MIMSAQSVFRVISIVILQGMFIYELFAVQSASLRWYEWVLLILFTLGMISSVAGECGTDEDAKSEFDDGYIVCRIFNVVILCGLLWKTFNIQLEMPISISWALFIILVIGLFAVFNFLYYLIAILMAGSLFFILKHTSLEGILLYLSIAGAAVVGFGSMIGIMKAFEEKKNAEKRFNAERRAREKAEREAEEARKRAKSKQGSRNNSYENEFGKGFWRGLGNGLGKVVSNIPDWL
jgi:hypothetical protein